MNTIVDWVNTQHAAENWVLFTPAAVELSLGIPQDEALKVLRTMAAAGILRIEVHVYCPEGHLAWGGPVDQVPGYPDCQVCDFPSHDPDDYGLSEQFVWVDRPVIEGDKPGKPVVPVIPAELEQAARRLAASLAEVDKKLLSKPLACPHGVWPTTNCRICWA